MGENGVVMVPARRRETRARRVYLGSGFAFGVGAVCLLVSGVFFTEAANARLFCPTTIAEGVGRALQAAGAFYLGVWWGRR